MCNHSYAEIPDYLIKVLDKIGDVTAIVKNNQSGRKLVMQAIQDNAASLKTFEARCMRAIKDLGTRQQGEARPQVIIDGLAAAVDEHTLAITRLENRLGN